MQTRSIGTFGEFAAPTDPILFLWVNLKPAGAMPGQFTGSGAIERFEQSLRLIMSGYLSAAHEEARSFGFCAVSRQGGEDLEDTSRVVKRL
jgi:hypothetical protein